MRWPVEILRLGHIRYSPMKVPRLHRHEFFHLLFALEGRGYVNVDGAIHELKEGDVHFYHPSWFHDIWARPHTRLEAMDLRFLVPEAEERERLAEVPPLICGDTYPILELLRRIERVGRVRPGMWRDLAHAYLIELIAQVLPRGSAAPEPGGRDLRRQTVANALRIMHQSLPLGISVAALAERLCVSPTHLTNLFRQAVGEAPSTYMTRLKLDHCLRAMQLEPGVPIYVLRRRYGWSDERHFRSLFKRYVGCSPREALANGARWKTNAPTVEWWIVFNEEYRMQYIHKAGAL